MSCAAARSSPRRYSATSAGSVCRAAVVASGLVEALIRNLRRKGGGIVNLAPVTGARYLSPMRRPSVIAHRGASGYEYENSRAAFRRAVMLDADGIELDVHA